MASKAVLKAVTSARLTQTRLLVQMGSDVNGKDVKGHTPLIHALFVEEPKVRGNFLRLLLKAGALVSLADQQKRNALMWACRLGSQEDVKLLLRYADDDLDINAQNQEGQTALWVAVDSGKVDVVRELLEVLTKYELSLEVPDCYGVTPAIRATTLGHLECLQVLITHLDTNVKSNNTLINIAKVNKLLQSLSLKNDPKTNSLAPIQEKAESKVQATPKLPPILDVSTDKTRPPPSPVADPSPSQPDNDAMFSVDFLRDPTRCSTPRSFTRSPSNCCPRPERSSQVSPIPFEEPQPTRGLPSVGSETARHDDKDSEDKPHAHVQFEDQRQSLEDLTCVHSPSPFLDYPPGFSLSRILVRKPAPGVVMIRGSVRDSIPSIFRLFAEQTSGSFRKPAVEPPPPKKIRPQLNTRSSWAKIKGLSLIGGLGSNAKGKAKVKRRSGNFE